MNKIKSALIILAALSMLAACGESFRAKQIETVPTTNGGPVTGGVTETETPPPITDPAPANPMTQQFLAADQDFVDRYDALLQNTAGTNTLRILTQSFGVTKRLLSPTVDNITFEVNIAMACDNVETIAAMFDIAQVTPGAVLRVGPQNFFTVDMQCIDAACDNMNVAVMNNDGGDRVALIALTKDMQNSTNTVHRMIPVVKDMAPNGENFFAAEPNYFDYVTACSNQGVTVTPNPPTTQPEVVDPTSIFNGTGTESPGFTNPDPQLDPFFTNSGSL